MGDEEKPDLLLVPFDPIAAADKEQEGDNLRESRENTESQAVREMLERIVLETFPELPEREIAKAAGILTKQGYLWRARKHLKTSCEACGIKKRLQSHHIDQNVENNEKENIQTLCKSCHDFWHTLGNRIGKYPVGRMPCLITESKLEPYDILDTS